MHASKDDIKKWLKDIGKDRFWLAEVCGVEKVSVDGWFSRNKFPSKALLIIRNLISENTSIKELRSLPNPDSRGRIPFELDVETLERAEKEALRLGMTLSAYCSLAVEWCSERPNISEEIAELLEEEQEHPLTSFKPTSPLYEEQVIGNIAAGSLEAGDTIPYTIKTHQQLSNGEYILRVNGNSMEPQIMDGTLVIMRKHTVPPIPKIGTIVEYHDERGVTIKKLAQRKTPEGKKEYILHSINPSYPDIHPMDGGKISAVYVRTLSIEA